METMRASIAWLLVVALVVGPRVAWADPARDARHHVRDAKRHLAAGELDAAIADWQAAYDLTKEPSLLRDLGDAYARKGDREQTRAYWTRYLAAAPAGRDHDVVAAKLAAMDAEDAAAAKAEAEAEAEVERRKREAETAAREEAEAAQRAADRRAAEIARQREEVEAARRAEAQRLADAEKARWDHHATDVRARRRYGWILVGMGIGLGVTAGVFTALSAEINDEIKHGGQFGPSDVVSLEVDGQIEGQLAWSFGLSAVACAAIGVPILLLDPKPGAFHATVSVTGGPAGGMLSLSGVLP